MTSLVYTIQETLRYRGKVGQWSWVAHRISGLGVVLFLTLHVFGVAWSVFYPELWEKSVAVYQSPLFTLGEFALIACVIYHAYNGLRISILDSRPPLWKHQRRAANIVIVATVITLLPIFALMVNHVLHFYGTGPSTLGLDKVIEKLLPFVVGIPLAIIAAILVSGIYGLIAGDRADKAGVRRHGSRVERFWWSYMRLSGFLIVPLVFGHLALMHVIQGVFAITTPQATVAGVPVLADAASALANGINNSGTAVEYVAERWNFLMAGVAVWRLYDFALLALVVVHGFNGLRYVLTDYTMKSPLMRRASVYLCVIGAVVLLVLGGGALLGTITDSAVRMAEETRIELFGPDGGHSVPAETTSLTIPSGS